LSAAIVGKQSGYKMKTNRIKQIGFVLLLAGLCDQRVLATDFVWALTNNNLSTTAASWTNGVVPATPGTYTDNFIITNNTVGANVATLNASYNIANLIATNTGTTVRNIFILNTATVAVSGTSIIGSNTSLSIGQTTGGALFSNNNLFVTGNGIIRFNNDQSANLSSLIVGGNFTNTTDSVIRSAGTALLSFDSTTFAITNAGLMSFLSVGSSPTTPLTLTVGSGSNYFFANSGTLLVGFANAAPTGNKMFAISNQFVNTSSGWFVVTNDTTSATVRAINVNFTGAAGGASTNAGNIRMVSTTTNAAHAAGTITFANGGFVNLGTISVNQATNATSAFILSEASAIFSNTGHVIMEPGGSGTFAIRADSAVNVGTNLINDGTLLYQNRTGGAGILQNSGVILFNGGMLSVATLINTSSGVISNSQAAGGTMIWTNGIIQNFGTIASGSGVLTNAGTIFLNGGSTFTGTLTNTATGSLILSNGTATFDGTLANAGTVLAARGYTNQINTFVSNRGTIILSNANTVLSFANGAYNAGTILLRDNAAVLNIGGTDQLSANNSGLTFTNAAGATLQIGVAGITGTGGTIRGATNGLGILNQGLITIPNVNPSPVTGMVDAAVMNDVGGTIFVGGAANFVTFTSLATNRGTITLAGNVAATVAVSTGDVLNEGVILLAGQMSFTVPGWIHNYGDLTWNTKSSGGTLGGGSGIVNFAGATLTIANSFISGSDKTISGVISNFGTMVLLRPTMQPGAGRAIFTGASSIYNTGMVQATWLVPSLFTGTNTVNFFSGQFTNAIGGVISVTNGAVFSLESVIRNDGTIRVETNSVFSAGRVSSVGLANFVVGASTLANDGTIDLRGGVDYSALLAVNVLSNAPGSVLMGNGEIGRVTITNAPTIQRIVSVRDIVNLGTIAPSGVLNAGNITNASGGIIVGNGVIQSLNTTNDSTGTTYELANGRIFNAAGATVLASGGTLVLSNGFSAQNGTIGADLGSVLQLGDGTLALTNNGAIALTGGELRAGNIVNNGSLLGNGLVRGDVTSFGTNSPGFSVGTLSITGSLTLASTAVTWMELAGNGSNDLFIVSGALQYGGLLIVTNSTGFTFAAGQSFQLFQFGLGNQSGDFAATNLPDLLNGTLVWDTAHLNDQGILSIAVIPEPSALALVGLGLVGLLIVRRRRT